MSLEKALIDVVSQCKHVWEGSVKVGPCINLNATILDPEKPTYSIEVTGFDAADVAPKIIDSLYVKMEPKINVVRVVLPDVEPWSVEGKILQDEGWVDNPLMFERLPDGYGSGEITSVDFAALCFVRLGCPGLTPSDIEAFATNTTPVAWSAPEFLTRFNNAGLAIKRRELDPREECSDDTHLYFWVRK